MKIPVSVILAVCCISLLLVAGCADVKATQKVGDFGTAFGTTAEEQKAIEWFKVTYGDPLSNNDQPARFVEPLVTTGLSEKNLPVDRVTTFPVSGGSVYFFVIYDNFKKGNPITVSWVYLENGKEVTSIQQQAGGDFGRFIVEFQKPDSGWGNGKQRITITGDGATESVDFAIGDSLQTAPLPYNPAREQGSVAGSDGQTTGPPASGPATCNAGYTLCNNVCKNLNTDYDNCGSCGKKCPSGDYCRNSSCCHYGKVSTGLGWDVTKEICNPPQPVTTVTTETTRSPDFGGKTMSGTEKQVAGQMEKEQVTLRAVSCNTEETVCSGTCVNLKTDLNNCGRCGNRCPQTNPWEPHLIISCSEGTCIRDRCEDGYATCDYNSGACTTDIRIDRYNCGACGNTCPAGTYCGDRICKPTS